MSTEAHAVSSEIQSTGEAPVAFIVRDDDSLAEETVVAACRKKLTNYKIPKQVHFVDDVPVTLSGKVLRRQRNVRPPCSADQPVEQRPVDQAARGAVCATQGRNQGRKLAEVGVQIPIRR